MSHLASKRCIPCEGGAPALTPSEIETFAKETPEWAVAPDNKSISREFTFPDFAKALSFTNTVAAIAEEEWHHPDIQLSWGKVGISLSTHAVKGLSENDFIMAAKINALPQ